MEKTLTDGSVFKNLALFSLPYLLSFFLQTLYGMADLFIIGNFDGTAATTSVSVGSQVMHMLTVIIVGLAMGSTVSIGNAVGAGDRKKAALNIGNTVTLFMALSLVLTVALVLVVKPIVNAVSTPAEAVDGTVRYLTICFLGIPFITAYNIISSVFRGLGDSKSPMYFIVIACASNIILDYLFIGALNMGPAGAALGTTLSQGLSVAVSLFVILKRRLGIELKKADFKPLGSVMRKILKIGIPISLQDGFIQISFILITAIANRRGLTDAAAVGIVEKIIGFVFLVPSSMLSAVSAIGAQNIGAGKPKRAVSTLGYAIIISSVFSIAATVTVQFAANGMVGLFTDDNAVILSGGQYLKGYILDCFFAGIHFSCSGYFCAAGKSGFSFLHNLLSIILVRIPGAYITSKLFTTTLLPMGLSSATGSLFSVIICAVILTVMIKKNKTQQY